MPWAKSCLRASRRRNSRPESDSVYRIQSRGDGAPLRPHFQAHFQVSDPVVDSMSIEVKCNKCKSTYNVSDKLAGGSVRCAKCRSPIHVPIVRQRPLAPCAASAAEAAAEADAEYDFDYSPSPAPAAAAVSAPAAPPAPPPLPEPEPKPEPDLTAAGAAVEEPAPTAQKSRPRNGGTAAASWRSGSSRCARATLISGFAITGAARSLARSGCSPSPRPRFSATPPSGRYPKRLNFLMRCVSSPNGRSTRGFASS